MTIGLLTILLATCLVGPGQDYGDEAAAYCAFRAT